MKKKKINLESENIYVMMNGRFIGKCVSMIFEENKDMKKNVRVLKVPKKNKFNIFTKFKNVT